MSQPRTMTEARRAEYESAARLTCQILFDSWLKATWSLLNEDEKIVYSALNEQMRLTIDGETQ